MTYCQNKNITQKEIDKLLANTKVYIAEGTEVNA